jgi:hypothetical protein
MATPLYKSMKNKGISFMAFPSASEDINISFQNADYKVDFTKFVLLNLPKQDLINNVLDFRESFYTVDPNTPSKFSDQLIESLRNYVANHDVNIRQAKINSNTDFYNVGEPRTVVEKIFWKWLRKTGVIDLEPALHKTDWDKNLTDYKNANEDTVSNSDYFRKYLWKERDVVPYSVPFIEYIGSGQFQIIVNEQCKFRTGDMVVFSGDTGGQVSTGITYEIISLTVGTGNTTLIMEEPSITTSYTPSNLVLYLNYNKVIQYIGEINAMSKVQNSKSNFTEITAFIPHQAGQTPTILFDIDSDNNYRPTMEYPILPSDIQSEILGAENLNSPIRTNPGNYAGSFYGQFDTTDKNYVTSNGDVLRLSGDYYGVKLTNNVGLDAEEYFEKLDDFDSTNIDGLVLDFTTNHYLKMNLPDYISKNFDEFNAMPLNGEAPNDFMFNAILWYYTVDDGAGNITSNLYGISFLNNPENDDDDSDVENTLITPYKKYVSNGEQDGLSYNFDLNLTFEVDNDMVSPNFDPTAIHNLFGFELYNNVISTLGKLQENFINISNQFVRINSELNDIRSLVYSQTDLDYIKLRLANLEELLQLYQTNQLVNSETAEIEVDYTGIYPAVSVNVIDLEFKDIETVSTSTIYLYNVTNSATTANSYNIIVPTHNKKLLYIINDDLNGVDLPLKVVLNNDLKYKQVLDILITPKKALYSKKLTVSMNYDNGVDGIIETDLITDIDMPIDLKTYNQTNSAVTYNRTYYSTASVHQYAELVLPTGVTYDQTVLYTASSNFYEVGEYVYISNFFFYSGTSIMDYSGLYQVIDSKQPYIIINLNTNGITLTGIPRISLYKGFKISILRITDIDAITGVDTSSILDRYLIEKEII